MSPCAAISTTSRLRPRPRSSSARPAPRSAPPASSAPTRAINPVCGTSPRIHEDQHHSRIRAGQPELIDHILVRHAPMDRGEHAFTGPKPPCTPSVTTPPHAGTNPPSTTPPSSPPSATPETPRRNWRTCQETETSWPSPSKTAAGPAAVCPCPARNLRRAADLSGHCSATAAGGHIPHQAAPSTRPHPGRAAPTASRG